MINLGRHNITSFSSRQQTVALSTGEAELTAVVKCSCETIWILQLTEDWWMKLEVQMLVDSSAALGVMGGKGAGKLRLARGKLRTSILKSQRQRKISRFTKI